MGCIISIDLGTTKICAAAVDVATLRPLSGVSDVNGADVTGISAEFHEQCPRQIWAQIECLIRRLIAENPLMPDELKWQDATGAPVRMQFRPAECKTLLLKSAKREKV